jgi:nitric oxide reductase subunit B
MNNAIAIPRSTVGRKFLVFAAIIMTVQFVVGLLGAAQFVWPDLFFDVLPFNITRLLHINTLVVALLAGFMGATYFLIAEEARGELYSERAGNWNFWLLVAGVAAIVAGYLAMALTKTFSLWLSEGREYIEAPRWADWAIVVVALFFLVNVFLTVHKRAAWDDITRMLVIGLGGLAFFYLFGMKFFANIAVDFYYWWWVIHLWVEGVWELIAAALFALLLIRLYDFPRSRAAKYVYIEAGLVLFTGIIGTGHHYYWIGTPSYWLTLGGIFSALEPLPLVIMVFDALRIERERKGFHHPNQLARLWLMAGVVLHFFGAGVWGFIQTLPSINRWTHGTQMTTAHGHLAFYGAYTMLIMAMIYYALPRLRFGTDQYDQRRGYWAFWLMTSGMVVMTAALTGAGIVQVYLERMLGLPFIEAQSYLTLFYEIRLWSGVAMVVGVVLFLLDVFALKPKAEATRLREALEPKLAV